MVLVVSVPSLFNRLARCNCAMLCTCHDGVCFTTLHQVCAGVLQQATHFQDDNAADAYLLLSMTQAANDKWEPSFETANTFWSRSLALAENDQTARIKAEQLVQAVQKKYFTALVTIGQLAVEVAECGWDRQTEEQLTDTLGAAAVAAKQQGRDILSKQIAELQQQLPNGVAVNAQFYLLGSS